jgi:HD-GYP domain-containing protein (c-di-GMP phosphodiesterase class II)
MDYLPIWVSTLRGDQKIPFDTYVKINEKYLLFLRRGDSLEGQRLVRLKEKKLRKMFILEDDGNNYRDYLSRNIEVAYDPRGAKSLEIRAEIIQGAQLANAEELMENPDDVGAYIKAKNDVVPFVSFLKQQDQGLVHIVHLDNSDRSIAHHGVTVATLATGIAKKIAPELDDRSLQFLNLGAMIHDIEHVHSHLDIARPRSELNPAELELYSSHPKEGAHRLGNARHFDKQVMKIIEQHEEKIDGKGFPLRLTDRQIDPLAKLVSTANALDRLITFEGFSPRDAVRELTIKHVGSYPLNHIQTLGDIITHIPGY